MKKVIFLLFSMIILTGTICAQDFSDSKNTSHVFASVYFSDSMAIGKISEYNRCSFGHGLVAGYAFSQIPVNLNLRAEFADNSLTSKNNICSWNNFLISFGASWTFELLSFFNVKPELDFGLMNNFISFDSEGYKTYYDTVIQFSCQIDLFSDKMKQSGISFELTPFYRLLPEKSYIGQYAGIQTGIMFIF